MSAHALLSPSAAERWLNCTQAPRLEANQPDSTSAYAAEGTLAHSVCELTAQKRIGNMKKSTFNAALKKLKADPLWNNEMLTTAETYTDHLLERIIGFNAPYHAAFEVRVDITDYVPESFGTCDCVLISGNELIITDYKHGKGVPVSAEGNPQMRLYALGALKKYAVLFGDSIRNVRFFIDQPRLNSYSEDAMSANDLREWGETVVKPKATAAYNGEGEFAPGEWCRFCRVKAQCRARANAFTALEDFVDILPGKTTRDGRLLTNDEIGDLLKRAAALTEWHNALIEYALQECLSGSEIPGWKAVEGRSNRTWIDQDKALEAILASGYDRSIVYDSVPKTLSQLEKLIGAQQFAEITDGLICKPRGKPALVGLSDKRPAFDQAVADFAGIEDLAKG